MRQSGGQPPSTEYLHTRSAPIVVLLVWWGSAARHRTPDPSERVVRQLARLDLQASCAGLVREDQRVRWALGALRGRWSEGTTPWVWLGRLARCGQYAGWGLVRGRWT